MSSARATPQPPPAQGTAASSPHVSPPAPPNGAWVQTVPRPSASVATCVIPRSSSPSIVVPTVPSPSSGPRPPVSSASQVSPPALRQPRAVAISHVRSPSPPRPRPRRAGPRPSPARRSAPVCAPSVEECATNSLRGRTASRPCAAFVIDITFQSAYCCLKTPPLEPLASSRHPGGESSRSSGGRSEEVARLAR